jgi:hypothetical protein
MSRRYFALIYVGTPASEPLRSVGPFPSADAASAWCEREGLGQTPAAGEWASVLPQAPEEPAEK